MAHYINKTFDYNSDTFVNLYDELPIWAAPFGLKLLDVVKYRSNIHVLDIGFGTGFPITEIAMRLGSTCKVYGIDPWEPAVLRTRKKCEFYGINNVELMQGIIEEISLADDSINLIVSNNGLNNVNDLDQALKVCARVIKPGGQLVFTMNLPDSMHEFYTLLENVLIKHELKGSLAKINAQIDTKRKPLATFKQKLEQHGFGIENIIEDTFQYKFANGSALFNHHFIQAAFLSGWKEIVPDKLHSTVFAEVEAQFNETAQEEGFITLTIPFVVVDSTML